MFCSSLLIIQPGLYPSFVPVQVSTIVLEAISVDISPAFNLNKSNCPPSQQSHWAH